MARQTTTDAPVQERRLRMSYDEFLAWADEDVHAEWVDGEVTVFVPPTIRHQDIVFFLATLLAWYARRFKLGKLVVAPVEMRLAPGGPSRQPDVVFVAAARLDRLSVTRLDGPADLVVDVLSDESKACDGGQKFAEYEAAGVIEYLVVDPRPGQEGIEPYRLTADGAYLRVLPDRAGRYHLATLPGLWLSAEWLRQDPLPDPEAIQALIDP